MTDAETQLAGFFAKYDPAIAELGKALRAKLRARFPGLFEVVYFYASRSSLVISYSPTERGYEGVGSLALYPKEVRLYLAGGRELAQADPKKLLRGSGKLVRYVALERAADLDRPEIEALIAAASKLANLGPVTGSKGAGSKGSLIFRTGEQDERKGRARK